MSEIDNLKHDLERHLQITVDQQAEIDELRHALRGLMKLTAAAYGHQVYMVPEYVAAKIAMGELPKLENDE